MDSVINFITTGHGIFAAIVVVVTLLAAVQALVRPTLSRRRGRRDQGARLLISEPEIGELAAWGPQREVRFQLGNAGSRTLVVTALKFKIMDHGSCEEVRRTKVASPLHPYKYRIELRPNKAEYDIRSGLYSDEPAPLQYVPDENESFLLTLVTRQPQWYVARVVAHWYDTHAPEVAHVEESRDLLIKFPQDVATQEPA